MASRLIKYTDLTPGEHFYVCGRLCFSKLRSPIKGKQLEREIERRKERGWGGNTRPYTVATVCDAFISYQDILHLTTEELFAEQKLYYSESESNTGLCFTARNHGYFLPYIAEQQYEDVEPTEIIAEDELANGNEVTLDMRVYKRQNGSIGLNLDGVIVHGEIKYLNSGNAYRHDLKEPCYG